METALKAMMNAPQDKTEDWLKTEFYLEYSDVEKIKFNALKADWERKTETARIPNYQSLPTNNNRPDKYNNRPDKYRSQPYKDNNRYPAQNNNSGPKPPNYAQREAFFKGIVHRFKDAYRHYNVRQLCAAYAMNGFTCGNEMPKELGGVYCKGKRGIVRSHTCPCGGRHKLESCRKVLKWLKSNNLSKYKREGYK